MLPQYRFSLSFEVRDYECDLQGIVNNAVYMHYLEHTRHSYLKQLGGDFAVLAAQGILLVVVRAELDYLRPLRSGDSFMVGLTMERVSRLRFAFLQDIYRLPQHQPILRARITATAINSQGRPYMPAQLSQLLERADQRP